MDSIFVGISLCDSLLAIIGVVFTLAFASVGDTLFITFFDGVFRISVFNVLVARVVFGRLCPPGSCFRQ